MLTMSSMANSSYLSGHGTSMKTEVTLNVCTKPL
jgi:hypothetical protein